MSRVAVIGGGVIGLSTAVLTQRQLPWVQVTLIADKLSPDTTGDGSAGLWEPYLLEDTPAEDITRWAGDTYSMFLELWKSPIGGEIGISLIPITLPTQDEGHAIPEWRHLVLGFKELGEQELKQLSSKHKITYRSGFEFVSFTCEPTKFLPYLMKEFRKNGGVLERRRVTSLVDDSYDVVVNCTGLGARELLGDKAVRPIRGQVMRVHAPWVKHVITKDSKKGNYIIPNQDWVILGGTKQLDDWNTEVSETDREHITTGCEKILPGIQSAPVIKEWVGLRPIRNRVRLQKENIMGHKVVHNYGHGGSGVTLFWGCAKEAVQLIQQSLQATAKL